jgi:hypothetical protein
VRHGRGPRNQINTELLSDAMAHSPALELSVTPTAAFAGLFRPSDRGYIDDRTTKFLSTSMLVGLSLREPTTIDPHQHLLFGDFW